MSEYGKLWEQVRELRVELKKLIPTVDTQSLESAKRSIKEINVLMERWSSLEKEMETSE